jgi:NAD-reducing hydrogenase small subunit
MERLRLATIWLGGCSGCHMSFLDLDEWLVELARFADLVYTPFADIKEYPDGVGAVLVEGAIANEDHLEFIKHVRDRTKWVISLGDCAVTGNVTSLRNPLGGALPVLQRSYIDLADLNPGVPEERGIVPRLLDRVQPIHAVVKVDAFLPGCPPSAEVIRKSLEALGARRLPELAEREIKFG